MKTKYLTNIIPSYNRAKYLDLRLKELHSLKDRINIIVIDDFSPEEYIIDLKSSNVKLIRNPKNLGRGNSIIKAIKYVETKFLTIFDDDDEINASNLSLIIDKLNFLDHNCIGLIGETDQFTEPLPNKIKDYLYYRFNTNWKDKKEFVKTNHLKNSLPFWLKGRRIPTSFIFSLCDRKKMYWEYCDIQVVKKNYLDGGMTSLVKTNFFKKSIIITLIYWLYRNARVFKKKLIWNSNS